MNRSLSIAFCGLALGVGVAEAKDRSFAEDVAFLKKHSGVIVLKGEGGSAVAVVPKYQCRVMTSAADAAKGEGFGWINYDFIAKGKLVPHINVFGGEDRFWLGPEGGQYSIFFKDRSEFDLAHWQTPAPIDSEAYKVVKQTASSVTCTHKFNLVNYSGSKFKVGVERTVSMLSMNDAKKDLGIGDVTGVKCAAFATKNTVTNLGGGAWDQMTGMLSIWILGMYKPSDQTNIVLPFDADASGPIVNDTYFGKVPADRLKVTDNHIYFKGDGKYRSKIGLPPVRAKGVVGSYDASRNLLTIVTHTFDKSATEYVNSMWELQDKPFSGDVLNSYNDGPPKPGAKPLGPFYELETSSPALALAPKTSHTHVSKTFHFTGTREALDVISKKVLGVDLDDVVAAFK